ncbi:MAG: nucleotidyltransferase domain-containing protein [Candidatus Moranbacteria bacterium]|nr:nucleotidyltransferase domain-containing protein [Candidatus Moranbacteria bacterium]
MKIIKLDKEERKILRDYETGNFKRVRNFAEEKARVEKVANDNLVKKIAREFSLELLLLFGSRADGTAYKTSDFDVAYLSRKKLSLNEESELSLRLSKYFRSENIDLVDLNIASPLLFYAIFHNCQVLYESELLIFDRLRAYSFKKYVETQPLYKEKFARLRAALK